MIKVNIINVPDMVEKTSVGILRACLEFLASLPWHSLVISTPRQILQNQTQITVIGASQGSIHGPVSFSLCVNVSKTFTLDFGIFFIADDTVLKSTIKKLICSQTSIAFTGSKQLVNKNKFKNNIIKPKTMSLLKTQKMKKKTSNFSQTSRNVKFLSMKLK